MDKKIRTQAALLGGADLVIELPLFAACSSAPDVAEEIEGVNSLL